MNLKIVLRVFAALIVLWLTLPTLVIIPISFNAVPSFDFPIKDFSLRWYEKFFNDPAWLRALGTSVQVALLSTLVSTITGVAAALGLSKVNFRGKSVVENLFLTPLIVPGIVLAIGMYSIFLRFGILGTLFGFVAAHTVLALPLVIMNVAASLQGMDPKLQDASASLGALPITTFFRVTLPLIAPGVAAGALFAFVTSFDEVILSLFIQTPGLQTLPVKIYRSVTQDTDPTVAAVAVIMMTLSIILILATQFFSRRKKARS